MQIIVEIPEAKAYFDGLPKPFLAQSQILGEVVKPTNVLNAPPELREIVQKRGKSQRAKRRSSGLLLASAAAFGGSLAGGIVNPIVIPVAAVPPMLFCGRCFSDEFGDSFVKSPLQTSMITGGIAAGTSLLGIAGMPGLVLAGIGSLWISASVLKTHKPTMWEVADETPRPEREIIRGTELMIGPTALRVAWDRVESIDHSTEGEPVALFQPWDAIAGLPIVRGETSNSHKLFMGMAGSGKSVCFRMLMSTMLPIPQNERAIQHLHPVKTQNRGDIHQAIVYDAKTEHVPIIAGHGFAPRKDLFILNPFDERAVAWDIARDIQSPADAKLLAEVFLQSNMQHEGNEQHQYFRTNARRQITGVIQTLIKLGGSLPQWTLRDIINAFSSKEMLRHVLKHHPEGSVVIDQTIDIRDDTAADIYSSSTTYLDDFRILASLWHRISLEEPGEGETTSLSLEDWVRNGSRSTLLLPNTRENETIITPLNKLVFYRLSQLLLDSRYNEHVETGEGTKRKRVVFLDEAPTLGKLKGLGELLAEGREFGVEVVLGVQAYSQMISAYGEQDGKTILGQCGYKAFLKCDSDTGQYASREIGQQLERYRQMTYSTSTNKSTTYTSGAGGGSKSETFGWTHTTSEAYVERIQDAALASEITNQEDPRSSGLVNSFILTPHMPVAKIGVGWTEISALREEPSSVPKRIPVDTDSEWLPAWNESDFRRLGLPRLSGADPKEPPTPPPVSDDPF